MAVLKQILTWMVMLVLGIFVCWPLLDFPPSKALLIREAAMATAYFLVGVARALVYNRRAGKPFLLTLGIIAPPYAGSGVLGFRVASVLGFDQAAPWVGLCCASAMIWYLPLAYPWEREVNRPA